MKIPQLLKTTDIIGVCAPSDSLSRMSSTNLRLGQHNLKTLGFNVVFSKHCFDRNPTIEDRVSDLMGLFCDSNVGLVMAGIGGFNSNELLNLLDYHTIETMNKPFIGFSDTTALCFAISKMTGIMTFCGPSFAVFCQKNLPDYTQQYFLKALCSNVHYVIESSAHYAVDCWYENNTGTRKWITNTGIHHIYNKDFSGIVWGGNMQTILALAGTPYFPNLSDAILVLEETSNKSIPEIRRGFFQLLQMGILQNIQALMLGRFYNYENQHAVINVIDDLFRNVIKDFNKPVLCGLDFGHTDPMFTLPNGARITYCNNTLYIDKCFEATL